jgi:hypothetical protein
VLAPVAGLTINSSDRLHPGYYTSVLPGAVVAPNTLQAGVFVGAPLPKAPNWKFNISPRYEYRLGNGGSVVALLDYTRTSSLWNDTERTLLLQRPGVDLRSAPASPIGPRTSAGAPRWAAPT